MAKVSACFGSSPKDSSAPATAVSSSPVTSSSAITARPPVAAIRLSLARRWIRRSSASPPQPIESGRPTTLVTVGASDSAAGRTSTVDAHPAPQASVIPAANTTAEGLPVPRTHIGFLHRLFGVGP